MRGVWSETDTQIVKSASSSCTSTAPPGQGQRSDPHRLCLSDPFQHVFRVPARGDCQNEIFAASQSLDLPREHVTEVRVVSDGCQGGGVGRQRDRRQGRAIDPIAVHEFGGQVLCVRRTPAVADDQQLSPFPENADDLVKGLGDVVQVLGKKPLLGLERRPGRSLEFS